MASETEDGELETYRAKRSADRTAEPFSDATTAPSATAIASVGEPRQFVIQKHAARRLHWDVRLEIGGVLRSWAVPRGPSLDPSVKRLAVMTEDHPLEYVHFEGIIPEGNYGAGAMIVWDRGLWVPLEPVAAGLESGKLLFELRGHKLRGVWTLVRTKEADGRQWLLIKKPDGAASTAGASAPDEASILSGLTIEELRSGTDRAATIREELRTLGAPRRTVYPLKLDLMQAQTWPEPFTDPKWIFELKYDGYRLLAAKDDDGVLLRYRSGRIATDAFPEISRTLEALPFTRFVIDGEVVVLDDNAQANFQRLQKRAMLQRGRDIESAMREHPVTLYAFDLLGFDDHDLRGLDVVQRKALLRRLLPASGPVRFADHIPGQGEALMAEVRKLGVEGIVAKRSDARYVGERSDLWRKIRIERTDDFVIVGFTRPSGGRVGLGALHLAAYQGDALHYVGRVGTGLSDAMLNTLLAALEPRVRATAPVDGESVPTGDKHLWVEPELVAEVRYKHLTDISLLRHPVFLRLRDDKPATECDFPDSASENDPAPPQGPPPGPGPEPESEPPAENAPSKVVISNLDKVFWPEEGYTKGDLIEYYRQVSPWLLPYLRDRPLVLTRYPDGIEGKNFFQKNAPPYIPDWLRTRTMWSEHAQREIEYFVCNDVDSIVYLANLATIPLHVWGSRVASIQSPDWCILDLDPKTAPFAHVVQIALHIRELTEQIGMPAYIKTSGSTGLHVVMPLGGQCTYEQCRMFAEILARVVAEELKDIATVERSMKARRGRVYIDFGQNGHGRLLVSPFSVRPKPKAPVSTPLSWDEVVPTLDHQAFTIANVPRTMAHRDHDPFAAVLGPAPNLQEVLAKLVPRLPT